MFTKFVVLKNGTTWSLRLWVNCWVKDSGFTESVWRMQLLQFSCAPLTVVRLFGKCVHTKLCCFVAKTGYTLSNRCLQSNKELPEVQFCMLVSYKLSNMFSRNRENTVFCEEQDLCSIKPRSALNTQRSWCPVFLLSRWTLVGCDPFRWASRRQRNPTF